MAGKDKNNHCGDCVHFVYRTGRKRGSCTLRPDNCGSALYASGWACKRFKEKGEKL